MDSANGRRLDHGADGLNTAVWPMDAEHFVTPVDHFFMRNHAPIPRIDSQAWRLDVGGMVNRPRTFSLEELGRLFPRRTVMATLVCAGLRRNEFLTMGPLPGELPWGPEPVSTGRWSGVALRDLLDAVGVAEGARHAEFVGLDRIERQGRQFGFGGSIEVGKAVNGDVLLASELNGVPLPPVHGSPLRTVVPGWIGARSVKWLGRITLLDEPSPNYFQSKAYRIQYERHSADPRDVSAGVAMTDVPLNAVFLVPLAGQTLPAGRVRVRGWAMGAGGRPVTSVEVSPDGGREWLQATVSAGGEAWTWILWETELELARGRHTLAVRATDSAGTIQPPTINATWNVKGYGNNAWHRVAIVAE